MTLLIDNEDSFTYNIVELARKIVADELDVRSATVLRVDELDGYDKIVISPGPGKPSDFAILTDVIQHCEQNHKPLLGICLGHQAICEYFGAALYRMEQVVHGQQKQVRTIASKLFSDTSAHISVGLYHSWAIQEDSLPSCLRSTAISTDDILMAVEHQERPIYGIQFHPESFLTLNGADILSKFLLN